MATDDHSEESVSGEHRLQLAPLPADGERPLWSVMVPTHDCAEYLAQTLESVLVQDPGPEAMQIEVIDDHSELDDPGVVVQRVGAGRVAFYRQAKNQGHVRNFETCLQRSRGQLIHLLHGDDQVLPGFYARMQEIFRAHPEVGAAFSRVVFIDERNNWRNLQTLESEESGVLPTLFERLLSEQRIQTPSIVVRREVYERLGGFDRRLSWTEDWEMWARISREYPVSYEKTPLALYRMHSKSNTGKYKQTGENVRDLGRLFSLLEEACATPQQKQLTRDGRFRYARDAVRQSVVFFHARNFSGMVNQLREAFRLTRSLRLVGPVLTAYSQVIFGILRSLPGPR